jgi:hypothetical protein
MTAVGRLATCANSNGGNMHRTGLLIAFALTACLAWADTSDQILDTYAAQARAEDPGFTWFSSERGETFYNEPHVMKGVGIWSCASCHLKDPRYWVLAHRTDIPCRACHVINDWEHPDPKHAKKRCIEPFAPSANAHRLEDAQRVETFLKLNCLLLLKRECTAREKGDVITWMRGVQGKAKGVEYSSRRPIGGVEDREGTLEEICLLKE